MLRNIMRIDSTWIPIVKVREINNPTQGLRVFIEKNPFKFADRVIVYETPLTFRMFINENDIHYVISELFRNNFKFIQLSNAKLIDLTKNHIDEHMTDSHVYNGGNLPDDVKQRIAQAYGRHPNYLGNIPR